MGEESENRNFKLFAELPDGSFSQIGPLVSADLTEAPPMEGYYCGIDLGGGKDECSIDMVAQLSEEVVCLITGLPRSVLHMFSGRSGNRRFNPTSKRGGLCVQLTVSSAGSASKSCSWLMA